MTLPGAETMNGGIMGDDCFLFRAGATLGAEDTIEGILEGNWARAGSTGKVSGVDEDCEVERCWCVTAVPNQPCLPDCL